MAENTWRRFNEHNILANAPDRSGVYRIADADRTIYVGESASIQRRLLAHYRGQTPQSGCIRGQGAILYEYKLVSGPKAREEEETRWRHRLDPVCNRQ